MNNSNVAPVGLTTIEVSIFHTLSAGGRKSPHSRWRVKYVFKSSSGDTISPVTDLGAYDEPITIPEALNLVAVELRTRETVFHKPHQD